MFGAPVSLGPPADTEPTAGRAARTAPSQAAYIRKEREYRSRIELLEREVSRMRGSAPADGDVDSHRVKLRQIHTTIMKNIEQVQDQTARILQEQERDLLRAFRARLFEVQTELEKANARATSGAQEWVDKCKRLEKELEWARETADRLDRHNSALTRENGQLRTQFKTQEDDREYLVRQLVAAKKDNARLRQDLAAAQQTVFEARARAEEAEARLAGSVVGAGLGEAGRGSAAGGTLGGRETPTARSAAGGTGRGWALGSRGGGGSVAARTTVAAGDGGDAGPRDVGVGRLRDTVKRLRRVLDAERRALKAARQSLALEMQGRTEVERLFRSCVADVQADVAARKAAVLGSGGAEEGKAAGAAEPADMPLEALTGADRREVMRRLLQQEEVLRRIGDAAFPPKGRSDGGHGHGRASVDHSGESPLRLPSLSTSSYQ